jgi:hypothetical protein
MLGVGMNGITDTEGRSQFSLWCILGAPLFLGTDVRSASAYTLATIGNAEAIAINQDALGVQGFQINGAGAPTPDDGGFALNLTACPGGAAPPPGFVWDVRADGHVASGDNCVTTFECATAAGSPVGAFQCTTNACGNELWRLNANGTLSALGAGAAGMCLTASDPAAPPAALSLAPCGGAPPRAAQAWARGAHGELALAGTALCLQLPGAATVDTYLKPLAPRGGVQPLALAVLNRGAAGVGPQVIDLASLGFAPAQRVTVRDVWAAATGAPVAGSFATRAIDSHETLLLVITPV